jgi:hypothetical protein
MGITIATIHIDMLKTSLKIKQQEATRIMNNPDYSIDYRTTEAVRLSREISNLIQTIKQREDGISK